MDSITILHTNDDLEQLGVKLPSECPICSRLINPHPILAHDMDRDTLEVVALCPNSSCNSLYITKIKFLGDHYNEVVFQAPYTEVTEAFPPEIEDLFPKFILLYNQAYSAEQKGLDLICGAGYRKSLEFLIKDFGIKVNPEDEAKIISMPLKQCINTYVEATKIKKVAERAVFLGNDETHYDKKWEQHDLKDLKKLIHLTASFIAYEIQADSYEEAMPYKK